ncbi:MAG: hypothetical protein ACRC7O_16015, partial [Fimbriiglobus sp.]
MGIQRTIRFPGEVPEWPAVAARLVEVGETPVLRMIDNQPAFPDEVPEPGWADLRVGLAGGMVTVRRAGPGVLACVTWGASDPALGRSWDQLCWAAAAAGDGVIEADGIVQTAAEFRGRFAPDE